MSQRKYFVISDTHFSHTNTWAKFRNNDDTGPLRPFTSNEEMDQHIIDCWNKVVSDDDVVYHLGDVVIHHKAMSVLHALRGHKRLVRGNHDIFPTSEYLIHFEEIYGVAKPNKGQYPFYLSHIPIHENSIPKWCKANIHGHLHGKVVRDKFGNPDPKYICVSVENVNYTPVNLDEILEKVNGRR